MILNIYMTNKKLKQIADFMDNGVQYAMMCDTMRNQFYDKILNGSVQNKKCIDVGFGTGVLSYLALKHGASHITAYEANGYRFELGNILIDKYNLQDKITLINKSFSSHMITDQEVLFHETIGWEIWDTGCFNHANNCDITLLPSEYCCDYYLLEHLSDDQGLISKWLADYNNIKGSDWPTHEFPSNFNDLPKFVKDEIYNNFPFMAGKFDPGVEFDVPHINEMQEYFNKLIEPGSDSIQYLNYRHEFEIHDAIKFASSIINPVTNKATIINHLTNDQQVQEIENMNVEFVLSKDLLRKEKAYLIVPKFSIKHNNISLNLHESITWQNAPRNFVQIRNVSQDVYIRQYVDSDSYIRAYLK